VEAFWAGIHEVDQHFESLRRQAAARDEFLCYLGRIEDDSASVRLAALPADHPCAGLGGSDNLVAVTTDRYADTPLVVRGPGAGPQVTAAGVFADVLRVLAEAT
jgi:aspartokinase/homoserine dehydrogenase 1